MKKLNPILFIIMFIALNKQNVLCQDIKESGRPFTLVYEKDYSKDFEFQPDYRIEKTVKYGEKPSKKKGKVYIEWEYLGDTIDRKMNKIGWVTEMPIFNWEKKGKYRVYYYVQKGFNLQRQYKMEADGKNYTSKPVTNGNNALREIEQWGDAEWVDCFRLFENTLVDIKAKDLPNFAEGVNLSYMFRFCWKLYGNESIANWDISKASAMIGMFERCQNFNSPFIRMWKFNHTADFCDGMFLLCSEFKQDLSHWTITDLKKNQGRDNFFGAFFPKEHLPRFEWAAEEVKIVEEDGLIFAKSQYNDIEAYRKYKAEKPNTTMQQRFEYLFGLDKAKVNTAYNVFMKAFKEYEIELKIRATKGDKTFFSEKTMASAYATQLQIELLDLRTWPSAYRELLKKGEYEKFLDKNHKERDELENLIKAIKESDTPKKLSFGEALGIGLDNFRF